LKSWKALVLLSVLILSACKDTPTSIGDNLIPNEDRFQFQQISANPAKDSSYFNQLYSEVIAQSEAVVIGKTDGLEASALLRFPLTAPDSIKTMLSNGTIQITRTWVVMNKLYTIGDKNGNFDFTVQRLTNAVDFNKVDASTFPSIVYDAADISSFTGAEPKVFNDTLTTFDIDPAVVKDWIKVQYDSLNTPRNYGVILKPKATTNKAVAYFGYESTIGTASKVFFEFVRSTGYSYKDTLSAFATTDTYYAKQSAPTETNNYITIQGGITYKNKIMFNLPQLPSNAVMHKAILEMYLVDSTGIGTVSKTVYGNVSNLVHLGIIQNAGTKIDTLTSNFVARQDAPNRLKYSGDVTSYAQTWINKGYNNGLILSLAGEEYNVSRLRFYGTNYPDVTKRPKLTITYSIRK